MDIPRSAIPHRKREKLEPLDCEVCGFPVPWVRRGRRPKVHERCRAALWENGGAAQPVKEVDEEKLVVIEVATRDTPRVTGGRGLVPPSEHGPQIKGWPGG